MDSDKDVMDAIVSTGLKSEMYAKVVSQAALGAAALAINGLLKLLQSKNLLSDADTAEFIASLRRVAEVSDNEEYRSAMTILTEVLASGSQPVRLYPRGV